MESLYKNRLLFWVLMFLIVVNLAALGTYFFYPRQQTGALCQEGSMGPGCVYQARLDLTDEQTREVDRISEEYQDISRPIAGEIKSVRGEILDELSSEAPDTALLTSFTGELSQLQAQLQRENVKHYMALKEVCTPEQALRLSNLYRELYGCPMHGQGRGAKHRHGR